MERRHLTRVSGPEGDRRPLFHLAGATHHRLGRASQQRAWVQGGAHGRRDVFDGAHVWRGDEEQGQIGRLGARAEGVEDLTDDLAGGLGRKRVLREAGGEPH